VAARTGRATQQRVEIGDGAGQPFAQPHRGFPVQRVAGAGDVRAALARIVGGQGAHDEGRARSGQRHDHFGQFDHGEFVGIADVDRAGDRVRAAHQADQPVDQIIDIAEGPGLLPIAIEGDGLAQQCLADEVRYDAPVRRVHARAIGVEDARDLDPHPPFAMIVEEQGFGAPLPFIIAGARADGVHMAPIILALGVDLRIAIDFAGGGLQDFCAGALGQSQHIDRAMHAGFGRLDRVDAILHRGGRTGQIVDLVHLDIEGEGHVVAHIVEIGPAEQLGEVALRSGEEIVDAQHVMPLRHQPVAQMRSQETGPAGDQYTLDTPVHRVAPFDLKMVAAMAAR
jgi:hypothetical protein